MFIHSLLVPRAIYARYGTAGMNVMMIVMMIVLMVVIVKTTEMPALSFALPVVARALLTTVDSQRRVLAGDVDRHGARRGGRAPELIIKH